VLVVDDDRADRALATGILRRAGFGAAEAAGGPDVNALVRSGDIALVLLEVSLSAASGYEVCRELRDEFGEQLPIVFMSGERTSELDQAAGLLVGADAYLAKPLTPDTLLPPVRRLLSRVRAESGSQLTKREHEVLSLLAAGRSRDEIAAELVISRKTVAKHIEHILAKLGVHSESQAVAAAFREQLVPLGVASHTEALAGTRRGSVRRSAPRSRRGAKPA
jgi:DNA-binding NarL/FixJ family response regulator